LKEVRGTEKRCVFVVFFFQSAGRFEFREEEEEEEGSSIALCLWLLVSERADPSSTIGIG